MPETVFLAWLNYNDYERELLGIFTDTEESTGVEKAKGVCQKRHERRSQTTDPLMWFETKIAQGIVIMHHAADYDGVGFVIYPQLVNEAIE